MAYGYGSVLLATDIFPCTYIERVNNYWLILVGYFRCVYHPEMHDYKKHGMNPARAFMDILSKPLFWKNAQSYWERTITSTPRKRQRPMKFE